MSLVGLIDGLATLPVFQRLREQVASGRGGLTATAVEPAKPYVLAALWHGWTGPVVVVTPHPDDARRLVGELEAYCGDDAPIYQFAESELLPYERLSVETGTVHERIASLGALHGLIGGRAASDRASNGAGNTAPLIVASVTGLMQKTLPPDLLRRQTQTIRPDQKLSVEATLLQWARMAYRIGAVVDEPGTAARRGGIVDIFGPGHAHPARIDLWGDRVDTLRAFEPGSQRSVHNLDALTVLPAAELLPTLVDHAAVNEMIRALDFSNARTADRDRIVDDLAEVMAGYPTESASLYAGFLLHHTLVDHLREVPNVLLVVDEPGEIAEAALHNESAAERLRLSKQERGELPLGFPAGLAPWSDLGPALAQWPNRLDLSRYHRSTAAGETVELPLSAPAGYQGIERLAERISASRSRTVIATQHSRRLEELLRDAGVGARETRSLDAPAADGVIDIVHTTLTGGWALRADSNSTGEPLLTLLSDVEVFGASKRRLSRPRRHAARFQSTSVEELTPGQYVVHIDHGIGRFVGTTNRQPGGAADGDRASSRGESEASAVREYIILEYADADRLFVPMEHLARLSPYVGGDEASPSPTRLGAQEWTRAVARARDSTKRLAVDLLALYAQRETASGFPHAPDTPWQREMEDAFPYVETPDQDAAITEVKEDLERPTPMDRLVCGDVGYGKTEVALRAAFKAVMGGKQVAVLVPTTVLAQQHYDTFRERLEPYPITVEVLSRFRTDRDQDLVVGKLKRGEADIVIGTHRLIQKDVGFKDLGLVIIDEEHRFGVGHKERMKELRSEVDVLTLTATPIPRTLHMAMAGIRDISTIDTPPEERLPIKTYLAEASDDLVREAILREMDRGGQVYYLHNRVRSIRLVADTIRQLVPDARVLVGHGQMPEGELASVMADFAEGEADVLVCTTIIESGLDIPAVNTLIVDRAHTFGLAQLYQLRGRIGRRSQRAYAYLLVERGRRLTETAKRRLDTIVAATELGAGFRIAMKDLEIRGAGNLLGAEQSGHIHAVGFDLYTRLLSEAVSELRAAAGEAPQSVVERSEPIVDLGLTASVPEELVPHMPTRMAMYQRLAKAKTIAEADDLPREFTDRFGHQLPEPLHHLLYMVRVRIRSRDARRGVSDAARRPHHAQAAGGGGRRPHAAPTRAGPRRHSRQPADPPHGRQDRRPLGTSAARGARTPRSVPVRRARVGRASPGRPRVTRAPASSPTGGGLRRGEPLNKSQWVWQKPSRLTYPPPP